MRMIFFGNLSSWVYINLTVLTSIKHILVSIFYVLIDGVLLLKILNHLILNYIVLENLHLVLILNKKVVLIIKIINDQKLLLQPVQILEQIQLIPHINFILKLLNPLLISLSILLDLTSSQIISHSILLINLQ